MMRNPRIVLLVVCALLAAGSASTQQTDASKTGRISDEACATGHTKAGKDACATSRLGVMQITQE